MPIPPKSDGDHVTAERAELPYICQIISLHFVRDFGYLSPTRTNERGIMGTNAIAPLELKRLRVLAGLSVRQVASVLRERGSKYGNSPSSYAYYENDFKGTYLPVALVNALVPILSGRGTPPIGERQVLALAGFENDFLWKIRMEFDERPRTVETELELLPPIIAAARKEIAAFELTLTSEQEAQVITEIYRRVSAAGNLRHPGFIESETRHACRLVKVCMK